MLFGFLYGFQIGAGSFVIDILSPMVFLPALPLFKGALSDKVNTFLLIEALFVFIEEASILGFFLCMSNERATFRNVQHAKILKPQS